MLDLTLMIALGVPPCPHLDRHVSRDAAQAFSYGWVLGIVYVCILTLVHHVH